LLGITLSEFDRAYEAHHGRSATDTNPTVVWAGAGGYWAETDINNIPEAQ